MRTAYAGVWVRESKVTATLWAAVAREVLYHIYQI